MTWLETLRTAYDALRTRRLRSALTMLGILIGIAAVMLTVGLGQGAQKQVTDQINKLGSNLLIVTPGSSTSASGVRGGRGSATTLTMDDAAMLADPGVAPDIARVAPVSGGSLSLVAGTTTWTSNVVATTPDWLAVRARTVSLGRFFTADELASESPVVVLGTTTVTQLLGGAAAVGQTITIGGQNVTVIGVLNTEGSTTGGDQDDLVIMPQSTYAARLSTSANPRSVSTIYIEAKDSTSLSAAYQEATNALLSAHGVTLTSQDFTVSSQQALVDTATSTTRILTVLLSSIAAISLLVGGIGVMNIMLVSVTERIREIGLRKALGATPRIILRQFLVEASLLGLVGGLAGLGLGMLGGVILPRVVNFPVAISPVAAAAGLGVSLIIGITAGVYPASRAARLAPIEALRSE
ncbi:MAG: ABC transporter permease [Actinomycetales bacterium]|nr:ABC transporter permease [Candidatus Phosphoribacter baldrii]MBK6956793.1 ABC transporter permease [Candidatus Phosphoribacter baldrii]